MQKLFAVIIIAGAFVCLPGCNKKSSSASTPPKDALEERLRKLAGNDATNCGRMSMTADPKAAGDCAIQAAQAKKPFYVTYDMPGLSVGIAGNNEGKLNTVQAQTGDAQGGPGQEKVTEFACPAELRIAQSGRATCTPLGAGMGMGGSNPHGGMNKSSESGGNGHSGMMAAPPGTPNPHGEMMTKPGAASSHGNSKPQ